MGFPFGGHPVYSVGPLTASVVMSLSPARVLRTFLKCSTRKSNVPIRASVSLNR